MLPFAGGNVELKQFTGSFEYNLGGGTFQQAAQPFIRENILYVLRIYCLFVVFPCSQDPVAVL